MSITSFDFLFFFSCSLVIYYSLPCRVRKYSLLLFSFFFIIQNTSYLGVIQIIISAEVAFFSAIAIEYFRKKNNDFLEKYSLVMGIIIIVGILAYFKYSNFVVDNINIVIDRFNLGTTSVPRFQKEAPIGISFYSLICLGYIIDCYWGTISAQKNVINVFLMVSYFPQLISGPITRYRDIEHELFEGKRLKYKNLSFGCQRMLWGFFKKLVISSRVALMVDGIYSDINSCTGFYVWIAAVLFMVQLYTDFSGCMDIILGASEMYGIILPENFRRPFSSTSVQEFWQRWHISLGGWLKDYILYPLLRGKLINGLSKNIKKLFGKNVSRKFSTYLGMLGVWLLIGLWHGGRWKFILGMGLWFWLCIVLNDLFAPLYKRIIGLFNINETIFSYQILLRLKVLILTSIGNMFFRLNSINEVFTLLFNGIRDCNPWVLFDGSILKRGGINYGDMNIIIIGITLMVIVGRIQEKYISARTWISSQILWFRWIIWFGLLILVLVFGIYGPGFSVSEFIYRGF